MSRELLLPELAESVVEGEILQWLVSEGEMVSKNQAVVEVMTDKATVELPSPFAGILEKQLVQVGDIVPIETAIAIFSDEQGKGDTQTPIVEEDDGSSLSLFTPSKQVANEAIIQVRKNKKPKAKSKSSGPFGRVLAVPAARALARDLEIDINKVAGSGPNGRVRVDDVRAYSLPDKSMVQVEERMPIRGLRRVIAQHMSKSHLEAVRTLHVDEADVSTLLALRAKLKPIAAEQGVKLSYLPFIMKAVSVALKKFPIINSAIDTDANEIILKKYYNLGMAVATGAGLVVPVIKNVDNLSLLELAQNVNELAQKAKENKLAPDEISGGSFTITNIGSLGGLFSFPIINLPEAAILGVHSIKKRAVVLADDSIVARPMLYLSLSFDHRIVDGAEAATFTSYLIELLEMPERLMLEL